MTKNLRAIALSCSATVLLSVSAIAQENAIATLAVLYGVGEQGLVSVLPKVVSPASALAFLVVLMLFVPCVATVTAMKREMEDWKWFTASLILMLTVSLFGGMITYHVALWAGL